ncbi:MAG: hypothetical protein DIU71_13555, partial [Proteobacteria bacterium]
MSSFSPTSAVRPSIALRRGAVRDAIVDRLERALGKTVDEATRRDFFDALSIAVREELSERWIA